MPYNSVTLELPRFCASLWVEFVRLGPGVVLSISGMSSELFRACAAVFEISKTGISDRRRAISMTASELLVAGASLSIASLRCLNAVVEFETSTAAPELFDLKSMLEISVNVLMRDSEDVSTDPDTSASLAGSAKGLVIVTGGGAE